MSKIQSLTHKLQFFHRLPCMHSKDLFYKHYSSIH